MAEARPTQEAINRFAAPKWDYDSYIDKMRGKKAWTATIRSLNSHDLSSPYGKQFMYLTLRGEKENAATSAVFLELNNGHIVCHSRCQIAVRFDDAKVAQASAGKSESGDSNLLFFVDHRSAAKRIVKAKRMIVEVLFYRDGRLQYEFDLSGLNWAP